MTTAAAARLPPNQEASNGMANGPAKTQRDPTVDVKCDWNRTVKKEIAAHPARIAGVRNQARENGFGRDIAR
jgi:hypothetical protein